MSTTVMHSEAELANLEQKYLLTTYDVETQVYTKTESDRIDICVRYVVNPRQLRKLRHTTLQELLQAFDAEEDIVLGSINSIQLSGSLSAVVTAGTKY